MLSIYTVNIYRTDNSKRMNCRAWRHCPERGKGKSATGKQPSPLAKGSAPWQPTPAEEEVHKVQKPRLSNGSVLENAISREGPDQLSRAPVQGSHTATLTGTSPCRESPATPSTSYMTLGKSYNMDITPFSTKRQCSKN